VAKIVKAIVVLGAVALSLLAGFGVGTLTFLGKLVVAAGAAIIADHFAPKIPEVNQSGLKEILKSPVAPRTIVYGKVRVAGTMVYAGTHGTDNKYLTMCFVVASHSVGSLTGTSEWFLNEEEVTLDGSGFVNGGASGRYNGKVRIEFHRGEDAQTADANMVSEITEWTTNHRLRGLAYYSVRFEFDREVFATGRPTVNLAFQGVRMQDPRSAPGIIWTDNAAVIIQDYLSRDPLGARIPLAEIPDSVTSTAANVCDELVPLKAGGTQARYTINAVIPCTGVREGFVQAMLDACAGKLVRQGGFFNIYVGAAPTFNIDLDDDDCRGPISITTRRSINERVNRVIGTYIDNQSNLYEENNYPTVEDATAVSEDNGEVFERALDLPYVNNPARAQRIAQIILREARQQMVVHYPAKLKALQIQAWSGITLTSTRFNFVAKEFRVTKWNFAEDGGVDLELTEYDSSIYSWTAATDEGTALAAAVPTLANGTESVLVAGLVVTPTDLTQGGATQPALVATWTAPTATVNRTEIQFKRNADSLWEPGPEVPDPQNPRATLVGFLASESIDVRVRHITSFGVPGTYSTVSASSTGAVYITDPAAMQGTPGAASQLSMWNASGDLVAGSAATVAVSLTVAGDITISSGSILSASGAISFGNENLLTTGTLGAGTVTGTSIVSTGTISGTAITGSGILSIDDITDSTSAITGSIHTDGGLGVAKKAWIGAQLTVSTGGIKVNAGIIEVTSGQIELSNSNTPASAAASGSRGTIEWDTGFIYVCTATNTWKRVAIATW